MLEDKVRDVFADMVVLKNPERTEFFSNLSLPSYMRDWLVMKFSDDDGIIDYDSVLRYIRQYIERQSLNCLISAVHGRALQVKLLMML